MYASFYLPSRNLPSSWQGIYQSFSYRLIDMLVAASIPKVSTIPLLATMQPPTGEELKLGRSALSDRDIALMDAVRNGNQQAFGTLVKRYNGMIYRIAWRTLLDSEAARDTTQDVFMKLWRRPTWHHSGGASLRTWLCRVALNAAIDARRRRQPTEALPDEEFVDEAEISHDERLRTEWRRRLVHRLVAELPDRCREVLVLCYFEEMSHRETAQVLGISAKAVESAVARARQALRRSLESNGLHGEIVLP